jgi:hypothetical protein
VELAFRTTAYVVALELFLISASLQKRGHVHHVHPQKLASEAWIISQRMIRQV